jgi:hypothetical protein
MSKTFLYRFADGAEIETADMTSEFMRELKEHHGECTFNGFREQLESIHLLRANSHTRGDGFKPGYHPGLNMEIRSNEQYQRVLKEKGLVEVGNEKRKESGPQMPDIKEQVIKEAINQGVQLSGQEIAKIKGEIA